MVQFSLGCYEYLVHLLPWVLLLFSYSVPATTSLAISSDHSQLPKYTSQDRSELSSHGSALATGCLYDCEAIYHSSDYEAITTWNETGDLASDVTGVAVTGETALEIHHVTYRQGENGGLHREPSLVLGMYIEWQGCSAFVAVTYNTLNQHLDLLGVPPVELD